MTEDALVSLVVDKIGDLFTQEIPLIWRVKDDVESLKQELEALAIFLNAVDCKKRQDAAMKNWLSSVRDVAYEAEDLIDTYSLRKRYAPPTRIIYSYSVKKEIEQLKSKIREIVERRTIYVPNLHEQRSEGSSSGSSSRAAADQSHLHPWRRSSPHLGDDVVVGFEQDANLIVERLLHGERGRQVVAITGMGGAGKTTLAAVVYNSISEVPIRGRTCFTRLKEMDPGGELQNHFDVCAWVPVHQDPNIMELLLIMIDQLGLSHRIDPWTLRVEDLKEMLLGFLEHKRYLIVLDDIWKKEVWNQLERALPESGNGSRIIVTTRFRKVAICHDPDSEPYEMRPLKEDDSWRLFLTKVFPQLTHPHDQPIRPRELEDLGRQLCKTCAGLPLALLVLGGLVSTKMRDPSVWSKLLDNMNWHSTDDGKRCLEILALSYYDLPYNIKFCFLYLGAFPQASQISASKLTKLWIGDDLIPKEEGIITLEDTATNYLEELAQRCLVEIVKRGADMSIKKVRVHDLLGELAKSEARESRFLGVKNLTTTEEMSKPQETGARRMALHQSDDIVKEILDEKLRALLVFPTSRIPQNYGSYNKKNARKWYNFLPVVWFHNSVGNISQTNKRMEFLRVLELDGYTIISSPEFHIKNMTRLRYMGLRNTKIKMLPFSGEIPQHLQTLDIRGTLITQLPSQVWTLSELRHLYLNSTSLLNSQALRNIKSPSKAKRIEMSCMPLHNLQTLKIYADRDPLKPIDSLVQFLELLTSLNSLSLRTEEIPQEVFKAPSTHAKLYKLKLDGKLQPDEHCDIKSFAPNITKLTLSRSNLRSLGTLGLIEKLRILKLKDNACQCREISCSPDSFPNLSYLKLSNLSHLELLNMERGSFPNLMHLSIHCCNNLHAAPNGLNHITTLQVLKCKKMPSSFVKEINDWRMTHTLKVVIQDSLPPQDLSPIV